jgi:hypothetical protein
LALVPGKARKHFDRTVEAMGVIDRGLQAARTAAGDLQLAMNAAEAIAANPPYAGVATPPAKPANGATYPYPISGRPAPALRSAAPAAGTPAEGLDGPQTRILNAMAWLASIGNTEPPEAAVAFLAGYRVGGGAFNNPKAQLKGKGLVEYLPGRRLRMTDAGAASATTPTDALTNKAMHEKVLG